MKLIICIDDTDQEAVLLVSPLNGTGNQGARWRTCSKDELRAY
ncbi:MAG: hypothetical protein ACOX0Q_00465 [Syntrophomonadaceae bacterium]